MSTRKLGQERVSLPPARTDTCSPTSFSGGGCPDSWVPHRGEVTRDCVISAARRFGLCSGRSPRCPGHISSPPRSFAVLGEERRMSSVNRPRQRCRTLCRAGGQGQRAQLSCTKQCRSQPLPTTAKHPRLRSVPPQAPRPCQDPHPRPQGSGSAADLEPHITSSSAQPKYHRGKARNFQPRR